MQKNHRHFVATAITALVGLVAGVIMTLIVTDHPSSHKTDTQERKPLYWVAPMDPNYRRDEPGLSPMGMALVPVFEESETEAGEGPGTIRITPDVVQNLGVRTARVERKSLAEDISTVGFVRYDEDNILHAHPRIEGWIEKLYIKAAGDPVKKGEPLYALYSPELVSAQEELILALNRDNKALTRASENRMKALHIPAYFIKQLKESKQIQQTVTFYVPQDGVVDHLPIREGYYVKPGDTILSIASLKQVWVEAEVFERQAARVQEGDPVTMTLAFLPGKQWQGHVDYIYPTLNPDTRTLRLRLRFDNPNNQLKPHMFATVFIHTQKSEPVLAVPSEALIRTGQQNRVVLALGDGQFKSVAVEIGRINSDWVEILSGLNEGERVVTSAQFLLDSESSQTSDFKRLHHGVTQDEVQSAQVTGVVNNIDQQNGVVNISRGAIEKWGREPATMDFLIGRTVDLSDLRVNDNIIFTFEIHDSEFILVQWQHQDTQVDHQHHAHDH